MATRALERPYRGVFPVAPTIFHDDGTLDLEVSGTAWTS